MNMSKHDKLVNIMRGDYLKCGSGVSGCEGGRHFGVALPVVPLELDSPQYAVFLLYVVYLLLLLGTPEPRLCKATSVGEQLHALGNAEVLPKCASVGAALHLRQVTDDGIADAEVPEVNLAAALQFVAQVAAEAAETEDDVRLLQYVNIAFYSLWVETYELAHLVITHLTAYLEGQGLQQSRQFVGLADAIKREDVAVQVAVGEFLQHRPLVARATDHLRVVTIDHAMGQQPQFVEQPCMADHLAEREREHAKLMLATRQRLIHPVGQFERAAASGYHLHLFHLVGDQFQPEPDVGYALRLVDDKYSLGANDGADACGGHLCKQLLNVWVVAVHPQHIVALAKKRFKQRGLAHLACSHDNNGLLAAQQRGY